MERVRAKRAMSVERAGRKSTHWIPSSRRKKRRTQSCSVGGGAGEGGEEKHRLDSIPGVDGECFFLSDSAGSGVGACS